MRTTHLVRLYYLMQCLVIRFANCNLVFINCFQTIANTHICWQNAPTFFDHHCLRLYTVNEVNITFDLIPCKWAHFLSLIFGLLWESIQFIATTKQVPIALHYGICNTLEKKLYQNLQWTNFYSKMESSKEHIHDMTIHDYRKYRL